MESVDEEKFDSFLNKTIILSSKDYFKRTMNRIDKERTIVDDEEYSSVIYEKINSTSEFDKIDTKMELKTALNCLSEIEQAVIFLLFNEEISRSEIAEILKIYDSTVSKIKRRAIDKLRKYLDGGFENEE
ncbi:MAG: sigma-70 family RNA polymerase sigma factor [Clostridia bacterium]|nr:sigma-70 family RNA polymerase sigma factor [Clostridia bacterium]